MPFTSGVFVNVFGATSAASGQIIQSAVWNNIHADYSAAFNQVMSQFLATSTNRNICWMNGGFEIWQRGAGSSASIPVAASTTLYTADRWYLTTGANQASVVSAQPGLIDESNLCGRIQKNSGQTGTTLLTFGYPLDTDELYRLRSNFATVSFRVRAGANWSPTSGTLTCALYVGTGAVTKRGAGFTGETTIFTIATNLTPGGAAILIVGAAGVAIPINVTQGEIQFTWTPVGTAGAADYFEIDDLELDANISTNFTQTSYDRLSFPEMLSGCKRHYQKSFLYSTVPAAGGGNSNELRRMHGGAGTRGALFWILPVEMRRHPDFNSYHPTTATSSNWLNVTGGTAAVATVATAAGDSKGVLVLHSSLNADQVVSIHMDAGAEIV